MIPTYRVYRLLSEEAVVHLLHLLSQTEWADGLVSNPIGTHERKNNLEALYTEEMISFAENIYAALSTSPEFSSLTFPKTSSSIIFSSMKEGNYYKSHHDHWGTGDYSTTIFLTDPSSYDGGELTLWVDGKERIFKLKPGWAVTYDTGTPHEVKRVTRGERVVGVLWTTSQIPDRDTRDLLFALEQSWLSLTNGERMKPHKNLTEAMKDPMFLLRYAIDGLYRQAQAGKNS